jgi:hypothetical protein
MKIRAAIETPQADQVKWLTLESDENETKGFFIYYHLTENNAYDSWHKSLHEAFAAAFTQYGIAKEDWLPQE